MKKIFFVAAAIGFSVPALAQEAGAIALSAQEAQALYVLLTTPTLEQIQPDGSRTPLLVFDGRQLAAQFKTKIDASKQAAAKAAEDAAKAAPAPAPAPAVAK